MGTIGTLNNYFQLSNLLSGASGDGTASSSSNASAAVSPTQELIASLEDAQTNDASSGSDAFTLNLSPQAQQLLNNGSSATTGTSSTSSTFTLTQQQQAAIQDILAQYKNA